MCIITCPRSFSFNPIQVVSVEDITEVVFQPDEKLQKKLDDSKPTNVIPFKRNNMSIETLFEEASERKVESLTDGNIKDISNLCQELLVLQGKIGSKEQELKTLKAKEKELSEQIIPSKLEEFGVLDIKLADGSRISAEPFYAARITAEKTDDAHQWLRDNGHGDIIKNVVSVSFGRGEDDRAKKVMTELFEQGLDAEQKESVHPSTLKAFAREQIEGANQVFDQKKLETCFLSGGQTN